MRIKERAAPKTPLLKAQKCSHDVNLLDKTSVPKLPENSTRGAAHTPSSFSRVVHALTLSIPLETKTEIINKLH